MRRAYWRLLVVPVWCWPQVNRRMFQTSYDAGPFRLKRFFL